MSEDKRWLSWGVAIVVWSVFMMFVGQSKASYSFPFAEPIITMDVEKTNGGGGTMRCPSVQACYIYTLQEEARGATQYCESITIKRNGRIVWQRKYL
jgi:hypothetical protein